MAAQDRGGWRGGGEVAVPQSPPRHVASPKGAENGDWLVICACRCPRECVPVPISRPSRWIVRQPLLHRPPHYCAAISSLGLMALEDMPGRAAEAEYGDRREGLAVCGRADAARAEKPAHQSTSVCRTCVVAHGSRRIAEGRCAVNVTGALWALPGGQPRTRVAGPVCPTGGSLSVRKRSPDWPGRAP